MNLRRVVLWLTVAFLVVYLIQFPDQAGQAVRGAGNSLVHIGSSIVDFVDSVV